MENSIRSQSSIGSNILSGLFNFLWDFTLPIRMVLLAITLFLSVSWLLEVTGIYSFLFGDITFASFTIEFIWYQITQLYYDNFY
jgi:hypothetical protein